MTTSSSVTRSGVLRWLGRAKMVMGLAIGYALGEYLSPLGYTRGRDDFVTGTINGISIVIGASIAGALVGLCVDLLCTSLRCHRHEKGPTINCNRQQKDEVEQRMDGTP